MFIKASILKNIILSVSKNESETIELLELCSLPFQNIEDSDIEIDWVQAQEVWAVVENYSGDSNIGLTVGANTTVSATGLVGMLAQSCPTVGRAWDEVSIFYSLFTDMMTYHSTVKENDFIISFNPAVQWQELYPNTARQATSQTALATLTIFSALCRKKIMPNEVGFSFKKPEKEEDYLQAFGLSIQYEMDSNYMVFNKKIAHYKIVSYASEVYTSLKELCLDQIKKKLTQETSIKSEVGKLIIEELEKGGCSLKDIATKLGYSERTLQRKLAKEGVKFKTYYNEIRMTLAKKLLENDKYNVSEIAEQLGYMELSSFRKIFMQTFGQNPKKFQIDHQKNN